MRSVRHLTRRQLAAFALITVFAVALVGIRYLQLPRLAGWGRIPITAELPRSGGLSSNNMVTFRGVEVGRVDRVEITDEGVIVYAKVDDDADIPVEVSAQARPTSALGEYYLDLIPSDDKLSGERLAADARIASVAKHPIPLEADELLGGLDRLFGSLDPQQLDITVSELGTAFDGSGPKLAALLDDSNKLITAAQEDLVPTQQLLKNLEPILRTQADQGANTEQIFDDLALFTDTLKQSDDDARRLLKVSPGALRQVEAFVRDNRSELPALLANLGASAEVLRVYLPHIKQTLSLLPAVFAGLQTVVIADEDQYPRQYFRLNFNNPMPCTQGFAAKRRKPDDLTSPKELGDYYCKAPATSQLAVRGARNSPCPNDGKRSATSAGCGLTWREVPELSFTTYDPDTGEFTGPDGRRYQLAQSPQDVRYSPTTDATDLLQQLSK